ncbi:MAG TPA: phosphate ABC transporter permease PstA [Xanthobacteraceae bacterium]|nr:phosphate ABC transporter permease PstA [Xanthobacteraceae bacterium]
MSAVTSDLPETRSSSAEKVRGSLARRHAAERRFKAIGMLAVILGLSFVAILFATVLRKGVPAFWQTTVTLPVHFDPAVVKVPPMPAPQAGQSPAAYQEELTAWRTMLAGANWGRLIENALLAELPPEAASRRRDVQRLVTSSERFRLRDMVERDPGIIGQTVTVTLLADANVDIWMKGNVDRSLSDAQLALNPEQRRYVDTLNEKGLMQQSFATALFLNVDSRASPASAGLAGAFVGSLFMMLIVIVLSVPIGVAAAIYLEEFAPKNRLTDLIEININNLAAVPSIVFGLLGAAVFINWIGLPLSAPLVGGLVLTLMTLPTIIITTRATLRAIPPSIRSAAVGLGASRVQTVAHHVLPLALPGILTGTIIGVAQALGETAPLLLIGMSAFVASVPATPLDQSTALPVQIYLWQGNELRNFFEGRTSAAIIVLLSLMIALNALAIFLRRRFERRW